MQKKDVFYYVGFIAGAALTSLIVAPALGLTGIIRLLVVIAGGVGGGVLGEYTYRNSQRR